MDGTLTIPKHNFAQIRAILKIPSDVDILTHISTLNHEDQKKAHETLYDWEHEIALRGEASQDARALLKHLHEQGCQLAVLTRNKRDLALITLKAAGLLQYFSPEVILGRDCAPPKPDPEGILSICRYWNLEPKDTVMVGDYIYDIEAGKRAGSSTIYVARKVQTASITADYICRDLRSFI